MQMEDLDFKTQAGTNTKVVKRIRTVDDLCEQIRNFLPHHQPGAVVTVQQHTKAAWSWLIAEHQLGAFSVVGAGSNPVDVYATLCSSAGLGGLTPRTIAVPLGFGKARDVASSLKAREDLAVLIESRVHCHKTSTGHQQSDIDSDHTLALGSSKSQVHLLRRIVDMQMNLLVLRGLSKFEAKLETLTRAGKKATIDLWILESELDSEIFGSDISLLIQFGSVHFFQQHFFKTCTNTSTQGIS